MRYSFPCLLFVLLCVGCNSHPQEGTINNVNLVSVLSGDVIEIESEYGRFPIRLFGIDSPELDQPYYYDSIEALRTKLEGKQLKLRLVPTSGTPMSSAWVWLSDATEIETNSINVLQVIEGWAWHDKTQKTSCDAIIKAQNEAREKKRGLWEENRHIPPWYSKKEVPTDVVISAIREHVNAMEKVTNWMLLLTVVTLWSALRQREQIEVLGLKIEVDYAADVTTALYIIANIYFFVLTWRVGDWLYLLGGNAFNRAVWEMGVRTWIFNPFAIGHSLIISKAGIGLLIFLWWMVTTSVVLLHKSANHNSVKNSRFMRGLIPIGGIAQLVAFGRIYVILLNRRNWTSIYSDNISTYYTYSIASFVISLIGFTSGFMMYRWMLHLQQRLLRKPN